MFVLSEKAAAHPRLIMRAVTFICLILITLVALPSLWPQHFNMLNGVKVDTDPENMLSPTEPVRVFHNAQKAKFGLHDMVVVGIVDTENDHGVFTPETLQNIYTLSHFIKNLQWEDKGETTGVVGIDLMAPSTVDNIEQAGLGTVSFDWLMPSPPQTEQEALAVREKALNLPLLNGSLVSEDGKALALYVPITSKDVSYEVAQKIRGKIKELSSGTAQYHITGLPVAQDQFGVEMFVQMAISAPAAMLLIFALMWYFFRNVKMIISPMLVAMASVIFTMGLLVATGQTVHIMSSMIPIFIMPIAVLDAIHILSDFFDRYPHTQDRAKTLKEVMHELASPMLYTSLTTAAGFGSLALTPIPPVQVFGTFIALGVLFAWILTVTMIPAYIMLLSPKALESFGTTSSSQGASQSSLLSRSLHSLGRITRCYKPVIMIGIGVLAVFSYLGIEKIQINDNPVKWFRASHEIRVADKALNERFGGTYMAYLSLKAADTELSPAEWVRKRASKIQFADPQHKAPVMAMFKDAVAQSKTPKELLNKVVAQIEVRRDTEESDDAWVAWDDTLQSVSNLRQYDQTFKQPEVLNYLVALQKDLLKSDLVGKSNSVADIVQTVHRELFMGEAQAYRIPETPNAVAQTLMTFQNSHKPQDLWKFITPDYKETTLWLQLKSGDNKDMAHVMEHVKTYMEQNPGPVQLNAKWFGLTYINVIWQDKMVSGMLESFGSSFIIVLLMMTLLFRSLLWGLLAMVPLTVTIGVIYGLIGWIGKDYDMPVAVLSSLSLGLAVDYAIHFLARGRYAYAKLKDWTKTSQQLFGEPARAIARNVIVLGVGFTPLLLAPLVPYNTVGVFISAILLLAGVATLIILPTLMGLMEKTLFKSFNKKKA